MEIIYNTLLVVMVFEYAVIYYLKSVKFNLRFLFLKNPDIITKLLSIWTSLISTKRDRDIVLAIADHNLVNRDIDLEADNINLEVGDVDLETVNIDLVITKINPDAGDIDLEGGR